MPVNKQRGVRIKQLMRDKGLTREALASESGYSLSLITRARNGHDFKTDFQTAICEVLETTPDFLNGFSSSTDDQQKIISELKRIDNVEIDKLILSLLRKY